MRLIYLSLAWIAGIYIGFKYNADLYILAISLSSSALLVIFSFRKRFLLWAGLLLLLFFGGIFRFQTVTEGDELQSYRGFYQLRGLVATDPEEKEHTTVIQLEVKEIRTDEKWNGSSGTVQIYAPKYPGFASRDFPYYKYGDLLEVKGVLQSPEPAQEQDDFDFAGYLARQGIYSVMYSPAELNLIDSGRKPAPMEWIYNLRQRISDSLQEALHEPQCSLVQAMLLGKRGYLSDEMRDSFSRAGTSHLLAISGVHVSIVAGIALSAGVWVFGRKRPIYFVVALAVIWLYVMLSGMRPSAIRAATMGSLWLYAERIGRQRSAFNALVLVAAVMLAFSPRLLSDVGFQLSFAAMAGLIFLTPIFINWGNRKLGGSRGDVSSAIKLIGAGFSVTMGAVLATLPLISCYFNTISLMSLPATFLTLPAVPAIITSSALVGLTGIFCPAIAGVLGWSTWLFVSYVTTVVETFAKLPFSSVNVEMGMPEMSAYYAVLGTALWLPRNRAFMKGAVWKMKDRLSKLPGLMSQVPTKWIIIPLLVAVVLTWTAAVTVSDSRLHVYVLDIGQGDSILVQKKNQQILIDGGPDSQILMDRIGDKLPFWDRNIELVVLTHPDADHITGLIEVLQRYNVDGLLTGGYETETDLYTEWRKLIDEKGVERTVACVGQEVTMDENITLTVLHPRKSTEEVEFSDPNNNSVVLRLEYGKFSMLLTGDIEAVAEQSLLKDDCRLRSTVLKVPHHGANTSTSPNFLREADPLFAAVSAGVDNDFGHPAREVMNRLENAVGDDGLFVTTQDGTIQFITDGDKLCIETHH